MNISKLRNIISKPNYYKGRLDKLADLSEKLQTYWKFECSDFFRGELKAELNRQRYNEMSKPLNKVRWYKNKLKHISHQS